VKDVKHTAKDAAKTAVKGDVKSKDALELQLPISVTGRMQLSRLVRELEDIENDIESQKARDRKAQLRIPAMSQGLADCVELNKVDILEGTARMGLKRQLAYAKDKAPNIHFTFAVEADPRSLQQLAAYVRKEIHPQALISVGLQPALVGGAYVRTPNHIHDFSLRALLKGKRDVITQALSNGMNAADLAIIEAANAASVVQAPPDQQPTPSPAPSAASPPSSASKPAAVAEPVSRPTPAPTQRITPDGWPDRREVAATPARQSTQPIPDRGSHAN
jgi:hypothetical protein